MKIKLASVMVDDQAKALKFYTEILGFVKKHDIPEAGWLTVVSPDEPEGTELSIEPDANPVLDGAAVRFKAALREHGIAWTAFAVEDVQAEYERLAGLGVSFVMPPTTMGDVTLAVLDDTCGNLIQIYQA